MSRPEGHGLMGAGGDVRLACTTNKNRRRGSYRTLRDGSYGSSIPGISCLAWSLALTR